MAKYSVNFSCGHEETVELFGKCTERERKIQWFESKGCCSECYREQKKIMNEVAAARVGLKETEVTYRKYKLNHPNANTVQGSYNGVTKTIKIYI